MKRKIKDIFKPTMTIKELAKEYKISEKAVTSKLNQGIKVEKEHTTYVRVARKIALHHLAESINYYKELKH